MADPLDRLLGSPHRVKIMRFFLAGNEGVFTLLDLARSLKVSKNAAMKEIRFLSQIGFLKKGSKDILLESKGKKPKKKRESGYLISSLFPYTRQLRSLIVDSAPISKEILARRFKKLGRGVKLVLLAGVFANKPDTSSVDVLVVGDNLRKRRIEEILGKTESEIGKELNYAFLDTQEFRYRHGMYDRFLLDILESDHDVLIDNLTEIKK